MSCRLLGRVDRDGQTTWPRPSRSSHRLQPALSSRRPAGETTNQVLASAPTPHSRQKPAEVASTPGPRRRVGPPTVTSCPCRSGRTACTHLHRHREHGSSGGRLSGRATMRASCVPPLQRGAPSGTQKSAPVTGCRSRGRNGRFGAARGPLWNRRRAACSPCLTDCRRPLVRRCQPAGGRGRQAREGVRMVTRGWLL
jgi:hypothetical protein